MEKVNENEKEYRGGDRGPKYLFRGPRMEWGVIRFNPNQTLGAHYHQEVEETFFFVAGAPQMIIDDQSYRVKIGDAFRISPKEKHDIVNDTNEPIRIIFIKTPYLPEDKVSC
ncbi:MAG: cupin domain-containing protein [bacterium]|nr:cupin domain-containing protein [bacterium]